MSSSTLHASERVSRPRVSGWEKETERERESERERERENANEALGRNLNALHPIKHRSPCPFSILWP